MSLVVGLLLAVQMRFAAVAHCAEPNRGAGHLGLQVPECAGVERPEAGLLEGVGVFARQALGAPEIRTRQVANSVGLGAPLLVVEAQYFVMAQAGVWRE